MILNSTNFVMQFKEQSDQIQTSGVFGRIQIVRKLLKGLVGRARLELATKALKGLTRIIVQTKALADCLLGHRVTAGGLSIERTIKDGKPSEALVALPVFDHSHL